MTVVTYEHLAKIISDRRLSIYLQVAQEEARAVQLYILAQTLGGIVLNMTITFEVILRNKINQHYTEQFKNCGDWLFLLATRDDNTNLLWDIHTNSIRNKTNQLQTKVKEAITKFNASHRDQIGHNDLVASLSFAYWVNLFYPNQYIQLGENLLTIFVGTPLSKRTRQIIASKLYDIKALRNRIAHAKPIIFMDNKVNFSTIDQRIDTILELTAKMGANTQIYQQDFVLYQAQKQKILDLLSQTKQTPT